MTKAARQVFDQALKLGPDDRAELASLLLESLDGEPEAGVEEAWAAEIDLRLAVIDSGTAKLIPWEQVRAESLAIIHGSRRR
jgi:putative addiction module component (TIGR02574 family)